MPHLADDADYQNARSDFQLLPESDIPESERNFQHPPPMFSDASPKLNIITEPWKGSYKDRDP